MLYYSVHYVCILWKINEKKKNFHKHIDHI